MPDAQSDLLISCFENVFPNLSRADIPNASHATLAAWDSVAHVTLLSLIGEAFSIDIDFEPFEGATSFAAILDLLRRQTTNA
jgi:acyl carrier protein